MTEHTDRRNVQVEAPNSSFPFKRWLLVELAILTVYGLSFFSRFEWAVWLAVTVQALVLLLQWMQWLVMKRNLIMMPLFGHGQIDPLPPEQWPSVTLVAGARNEARGVERAVRSMAAQDYPCVRLVLVNDHSTDGTTEIVQRLEQQFPNLCVLHDPPEQPGWCGKQNAIWYGVQHIAWETEWLLFTDADVVFGPTVLRDAVAYADREQIDFLTCIPYIETDGVCQELLLVAGWHAFLYVPCYGTRKRPWKRSAGIGPFMLARRKLYMELEGHKAVRHIPLEDAALGALFKKAGARLAVGRAGEQLLFHQYYGYSETFKALVLKQRRLANTKLAPVAMMSKHLITCVLPPVVAVGAVLKQVINESVSAGFTLLAVLALLTYVQGIAKYRVANAISSTRALSCYLVPLGGFLRMVTCGKAIWDDFVKTSNHWRGREIAKSEK